MLWATQNHRSPIPEAELAAIASETSITERRAADAERELVEWKKVRFMQDRVGEEFEAMILNPAKYGLFVELKDLFVEGLVPIETLISDRFTYRENTREIVGTTAARSTAPAIRCASFSTACWPRTQAAIRDHRRRASAEAQEGRQSRRQAAQESCSAKAGKAKASRREATPRLANANSPRKGAGNSDFGSSTIESRQSEIPYNQFQEP
jgi:ribonuclease R